MNPEPKQIWLDALRNPEKYPAQARGSFSEWLTDEKDNRQLGHCCLAVLAHEAAEHNVPGVRWSEGEVQPDIVAVWDNKQYMWVQTDDPKGVMERYNEIDYRGGNTPEDDEKVQWAWAKASEFTEGMLPEAVRVWAGLDSDNPEFAGNQAAAWNDDEKATFVQIADLVEENL